MVQVRIMMLAHVGFVVGNHYNAVISFDIWLRANRYGVVNTFTLICGLSGKAEPLDCVTDDVQQQEPLCDEFLLASIDQLWKLQMTLSQLY